MAKPPRAGMGRPKGSLNKNTAVVKDMVLRALEGAGGVQYLQAQAEANPTAFMALLGRVIPTQLNHGDADGEKLDGFKVILVGKPS